MAPQTIKQLIQRKNQVTTRLRIAIRVAIANIAIERKLDKIELLAYSDKYWRGGKKVLCKPIDDLLSTWCREIHTGGLVGIWTQDGGWGR